MFVTTFYSFKGGVGRTLALTNVAWDLAFSGKKVLVVDFDLEAPGLSWMFGVKNHSKGLSEYINDYLVTGSSPEVSEYCYRYEHEDLVNTGGSILVLPAYGSRTEQAISYNSIDWRDLYANHHGYLMIEDLKAQWRELLDVDYVLVDSRTGHTDVEGICTRQLPDAIVALFFPNNQNLQGLSEVVERVIEHEIDTDCRIERLYVASNVPDLDDEHQTLENSLARFQRVLGYESLDAQIHHYPSLMLVEEGVFIRGRPRTRLSAEFRHSHRQLGGLTSEMKMRLSSSYKWMLNSDVAEAGPTAANLARIMLKKLLNCTRIVLRFKKVLVSGSAAEVSTADQ